MQEICQNHLRFAPWLEDRSRRLPGIMPLDMSEWLQCDSAHAGQMEARAQLLRDHRDAVLQITASAVPAARELLQLVLAHLPVGYARDQQVVRRPDGVEVPLKGAPLDVLCALVQEDFCILQKTGDEHVLTAALLCFPASWSLAEKFQQPLTAIHAPVAPYTDDMARRVQRLFDAVRPERPLWRANALRYSDPTLFQPRREDERRDAARAEGYIRSERQSILRLPQTQAVIFSIHTTVIPEHALTPEQAAGLKTHPIIHASEDA